jgi:hypothetical protein
MTSQNSRQDIYDPKTIAVMDRAFAAIWNQVRADDPFRDYAHDCELRLAIGQRLLNLGRVLINRHDLNGEWQSGLG